MSFGSRLTIIRNERKMSRDELAKRLNLSPKTIAAYESGQNRPNYETFIRLCNIFNCNADYFMQDDLKNIESKLNPEDERLLKQYYGLSQHDKEIVNYILSIKENISIQKPQVIYRLPVYKQNVAAGSGQLGFEQNPNIEEFYIDNIPQNVSYGIQIIGDSMTTDDEKSIPNGSTVFVTTNFDYNDLEKEAVIVNLNGTLVCKEYDIADDGHLWLKSKNRSKSNEDRHIYNMSDVKIIGKVVKVII